MKIEKKYIVTGAIAIVSISAAALYWQYKKLMEYCISFNKIVLKKFSLQAADFDIYLNFKNNSSIKIDILSQDYIAYLNDKEIIKISNASQLSILPKSTSVLSMNVAFQPTSLLNTIGGLAGDIALRPQNVILKVKVNLKVKLWLFTINIPYEYKTTVKDLLANKQQNASTSNTKKC